VTRQEEEAYYESLWEAEYWRQEENRYYASLQDEWYNEAMEALEYEARFQENDLARMAGEGGYES
jgi:hypothetical protein